MSFNIAIDGPAGAGKSTIARAAAAKLGLIYVDTGAMYRAIALYLLRHDIDPADDEALRRALDQIDVTITYEDGEQHVQLCGEDVSDQIRTERVSEMASVSSARPQVRAKLLELQRTIAANYDVIMDGRDIGTAILPHAQLKIYLTASVQARAQRRYKEELEKGTLCTYEQIEADIRERDHRDMNREVSPLKQAPDAVLIDSSDMTIEDVVRRVMELAKERMKGRTD